MLEWLKRLIENRRKTKKSNTNIETVSGLGIALSGGSARGYAHIGVLNALTEHDIAPEIISGTSMGSLVGVLYAAGYHPNEIQKIVKEEPVLKMVRPAWNKNGLFQMTELRKLLKKYIEKDDFAALKKPFCLAVANINTGKNEIISEGPLIDYVLASCAVPVIFAPQVINDTTYIDGGLFDNLPADAIRKKCKTLIGVHVNYIGPMNEFDGITKIAERAFSLGIGENVRASMEICDYLIEPAEMQNYSFWDFDKSEEIIEVGYNCTKKMIEKGELKINE
ncbi:patatin-like phospholipase family protein [Alkalitalea saponilacus]|uniref:NTE family protein n=1 Tax=Alkalitalea saponilacus TaxID=889453 RepID=A0A1T5G9L3_9BACT|nr:patatin-like phospholipase family protein [Alkalitalea saponilacus]ASB47898.1 patatin [Alkalitalea saponilacus]SKC05027.1 NTE family protein [Alkalitalea saponilacus]